MGTSDVWQIEQNTELLMEFGKVAVRWAAIDYQLTSIVSIALSNEAAAHKTILDSVGAGRQRLDTFNEIVGASRFSQAERSSLIEIARSLKGLLADRNDIIHSPLVARVTIEDQRYLNWTLQKIRRKGGVKPFAIDDVKAHVRAVGELARQLEEAFMELYDTYEKEYEAQG